MVSLIVVLVLVDVARHILAVSVIITTFVVVVVAAVLSFLCNSKYFGLSRGLLLLLVGVVLFLRAFSFWQFRCC